MTAPFKGRIGNQMFIYATLLGLASSQNRTAFTRSGTILENAFEITHVNNTISTAGFRTVGESKFATFDARLLKLSRENITLAGYFQVWKYFRNIDEYIRREFTLRAAMREQINELLDKFRGDVKGHILVGVHVRRGDLLFSKFKRYGYGVAKASYFMKAFERMRSMLNSSDVTFVVVSDDLEWCHENLNSTDVQILEPGSAVLHFGVLASCDHVIISGGTYGWWAAWLANGITIYYDRFFINGTDLMRGVSLQDYYPPEWVALGD
ncbi:unnamed protein product [Lymnaea stagnalis]|uniref:L-Fucosyltransferase n=1 Tax=Lymnaea stagnalis TaxID=6523 RepID=A0AAV2IQG1_LYMST